MNDDHIKAIASSDGVIEWHLPPSFNEHQHVRVSEWLQQFLSIAEEGQHDDVLSHLKDFTIEQQRHLSMVVLCSEFCGQWILKSPQSFLQMLDSGELYSQASAPDHIANLQAILQLDELPEKTIDEKELMHRLRQYRNGQQVRIIWRDLCGVDDLRTTMQDLSALADACIDGALQVLYAQRCKEWGTPIGKYSGEPQQLVVLGMGKLGAAELNLSSDIDLIFAFEEAGETQGVGRAYGNSEFFTRLGQRLIYVLNEITVDGFVFRVDMRLRPYGKSGALVMSFASMEAYYQDQGREWERYAMVKARVVAGDQCSGARLQQQLEPFVYRRYIDFGVIASLRDMKSLIRREVQRRGAEHDIKIGPGGIREIEFIVQVFQLIWGGKQTTLRTCKIYSAMEGLKQLELLDAHVVEELKQAYDFLRRVEHRLQAKQDRQTQSLPVDEQGQQDLANSMNYSSWTEFETVLTMHRSVVTSHFEAVVAENGTGEDASDNSSVEWLSLWLDDWSLEDAREKLEQAGFDGAEQLWERLQQLRDSRKTRALQITARERLDKLMPLLLACCARVDNKTIALLRILKLVEAVLRRSAYMALMTENPGALKHLAELCSESPWIADIVAQQPILLDELLNEAVLYKPPGVAILKDDLRQQMLRIPEDDFEWQIEALRYFKHAHVLRVAASEVRGTLPLMKVSDYLTWIAEVLLDAVLNIAWAQMVAKYGCPAGCSPQIPGQFIIVAYGKMGGIELGYGSDLDLVFIYDSDLYGMTDGERSITNETFYTRLAQRMLHILTVRTLSDAIYDVDMRLRPSGNNGLLVTRLEAFKRYQDESAWTWEHQALVRARCVTGDPALAAVFNQEREFILGRARDAEALKQDIVDMRDKMIKHLSSWSGRGKGRRDIVEESFQAQTFHLKQDPGGIVDIEFIVQYLVLRWAHEHPSLMAHTDNIRILCNLASVGLMSEEMAETLVRAYKLYRAETHRKALLNQDVSASTSSFEVCRQHVQQAWQVVFDA